MAAPGERKLPDSRAVAVTCNNFRMAWNRSKQETLALPINALALLILEDYATGGGWN
jgi:hypothetical protein